MRVSCALACLLVAAGCTKPPSVDTFTASPLPAACVALRSPNGQRQALLVRFGTRWHGHVDDILPAGRTGTSRAVFAVADDGAVPSLVHPENPDEPPIELTGWKPVQGIPLLVVEAWAAGSPALRQSEPASLVAMIRVAGALPAARLITAALANELAAAAGLPDPGADAIEDPGLIVSRVAVEAAARAVINEDTGEVNKLGRIAILQIPVFLNNRFLAVEHFTFEDHGGSGGGFATSRFSLHNLETGDSPDPDELLNREARAKLAQFGPVRAGADDGDPLIPEDWHPARPGIVLFYRAGTIAPIDRGAVRVVVRWKDVLPLLPADSPLRALAGSISNGCS